MTDRRPYLVRAAAKQFRNRVTGEIRTVHGYEVVNAFDWRQVFWHETKSKCETMCGQFTARYRAMRNKEKRMGYADPS